MLERIRNQITDLRKEEERRFTYELECSFLGELHILLNPCEKNVIGMDFLFCGMFILLGFILFYLERCLRYCGDNCKLTYKLQKNVRGKREIYV